ncbi:MAG: hypothetical protein ACI4VL_06480 [Bacilli bacterium]
MQLLYKEYYNIKSKTICPIIQMGYSEKEKNIIPNFETKIEYYDTQEDIFVVDIPFSNGIFSNISTKTVEIIKTFYDFGLTLTKKGYINSNAWNYFLLISNISISPIQKSIKTRLADKLEKENIRYKDIIHLQNYYSNLDDKQNNINDIQVQLSKLLYNIYSMKNKNKSQSIELKYKMIKFDSKDFNEVFFYDIEKNADIIITYSSFCKNELELIYTFLNIIFSTNYDYKLFTCFNCNSFFIDTNGSYIHCPYCRKVVQKMKKKNYDQKPIVKLENRIDAQYYSVYTSENERKEYLKEKKIAKGKYKNNEKKLMEWYLSKDKKRKHIKN